VILRVLGATGLQTTPCFTSTAIPSAFFELDDLTMLIGPDESATLLEVGVARAEGFDFIVHAMVARTRFLE